MPQYKHHLFAGLCLFSCTILIMSILIHPTILDVIEWLMFALLGSLFPDIDIKSKGQKIFYRTLLAAFCILLWYHYYAALIMLSFIAFTPLIVSHRTWFHNMWFILFFSAVGWTYCYSCAPLYAALLLYDLFFFCLGCFSHIWLDLGLKRAFRFRFK